MGKLTACCEENGVPYSGVPGGEIKKSATSKGNASKGEMIAATQEWGYSPADDNEADAIAIFHLQQTKNPARSEEHTSELQSLMRISYAVFCLKKKNPTPNTICTQLDNESQTYNHHHYHRKSSNIRLPIPLPI